MVDTEFYADKFVKGKKSNDVLVVNIKKNLKKVYRSKTKANKYYEHNNDRKRLVDIGKKFQGHYIKI